MVENNLILQNENNQNENVFETKSQEIKNLEMYVDYSSKASKIVLVCWLLFFLIIPLIVGLIIELIWCVKTLTLDNKDLKNDALLWGLLGLLLIPIIPIFIMKSKVDTYLAKLNTKI